jgi:hypothetical protein
VIPARLLVRLHEDALLLQDASETLLRHWGNHLLADWRSLELLAERERLSDSASEPACGCCCHADGACRECEAPKV